MKSSCSKTTDKMLSSAHDSTTGLVYIGAVQGPEVLLRCSCAQGKRDQTGLFWTVQRTRPAMQRMCPPLPLDDLPFYSSFAGIVSLILQNTQKTSLR